MECVSCVVTASNFCQSEAQEVKDKKQETLISSIPAEIFQNHIFPLLSAHELTQASRVCTIWRNIIHSVPAMLAKTVVITQKVSRWYGSAIESNSLYERISLESAILNKNIGIKCSHQSLLERIRQTALQGPDGGPLHIEADAVFVSPKEQTYFFVKGNAIYHVDKNLTFCKTVITSALPHVHNVQHFKDQLLIQSCDKANIASHLEQAVRSELFSLEDKQLLWKERMFVLSEVFFEDMLCLNGKIANNQQEMGLGEIIALDIRTGEEVLRLKNVEIGLFFQYNKDIEGIRTIYFSNGSRSLIGINLDTKEILLSKDSTCIIAQTDTHLVLTEENGGISVYNTITRQEMTLSVPRFDKGPFICSVCCANDMVFVVDSPNKVYVWSLIDGQLLHSIILDISDNSLEKLISVRVVGRLLLLFLNQGPDPLEVRIFDLFTKKHINTFNSEELANFSKQGIPLARLDAYTKSETLNLYCGGAFNAHLTSYPSFIQYTALGSSTFSQAVAIWKTSLQAAKNSMINTPPSTDNAAQLNHQVLTTQQKGSRKFCSLV